MGLDSTKNDKFEALSPLSIKASLDYKLLSLLSMFLYRSNFSPPYSFEVILGGIILALDWHIDNFIFGVDIFDVNLAILKLFLSLPCIFA